MPFDHQQFRSELVGDGARPNLFEVNIPLPASGFANIGGALDFNRKISFMCRTASLPSSQIGPVSMYYFGRELKFAGNRIFTEWDVTVINDEDFTVRNAMEKWMNGLNSHRSNLRDANAYNNNQYTTDADVLQYGKRGEILGSVGIGGRPGPIKKYKMIGAWPVSVSQIDLDWADNDRIEEFAVTFAFQWWESLEDNVTT